MGINSRAVVKARREEFANYMRHGLGYNRDWEWFRERYGLSKACFEKDRTAIYKIWREEMSKNINDVLADMINKLNSDRELAREFGQISAAVAATKVEAQLRGLISKQGEVVVNNNTLNLNLENFSVEELKQLLNEKTDG